MKPGQILNDGKIPGLGVRRGENRLTWRLKVPVAKAGIRYTTNAGEERVRQFRVETLNPVKDLTLAEARDLAEIIKGKIKAEVRDPVTLRRRANAAEITLKQAWDRYVEGRKIRRFDKSGVEVQKPLSPKSIRDLEDTLRLYFGDWQDRTLAALSQERDGFEARFYDLTNNRGGRTANKAVAHFRAVWREAKGKLPELPDCPADAVTKLNKEHERKSAYQPEELPAVVNAVWKAGRFKAGLHLFLMLTGQRSGAVKRAKRDQYHRDTGYLDLIDDKGQSHPVPLSPVLIELLDAMIALGDRHFNGTPFIFPAYSKSGHLTDTRVDAPPSAMSFGNFTPEQLGDTLAHIPVENFRGGADPDWISFLMACHWMTGGEGREEFVAWSISDPIYADHEEVIRKRWDTASPTTMRPSTKGQKLRKKNSAKPPMKTPAATGNATLPSRSIR